jgi:hypothetical protein
MNMMTGVRKHRTQMTRQEISAIETSVHSVQVWTVKSSYVVGRQRERTVSSIEVTKALQLGSVIELQDCGRVLMRSHDGICVVACLKNRTVVTVWYNTPEDNHYTLNIGAYRWYANVIPYLHGFMRTA